MKSLKLTIFLIAFLLLFNLANTSCVVDIDENEDEIENEEIPSSASSCHSRTLSNYEVEMGMIKCCYLEIESEVNGRDVTERVCMAVTQKGYDDIDELIDEIEDLGEGNDVDVEELDCNSNYIKSVLLLLLLFL